MIILFYFNFLNQVNFDVKEIRSVNDELLKLDSIANFNSDDVILIAGTNTNYTCDYTNDYKSILNITSSKQFLMVGGIFKFGTSLPVSTDYYFSWVSFSDAFIKISKVEIVFISTMNNLIFVEGGRVVLEYLKIDKQAEEEEKTKWVHSLIHIHCNISGVSIEVYSSNITNSIYKYIIPDPEIPVSEPPFIYFVRNESLTNVISFNITSSYFNNNTFNMGLYGGSVCLFHSYNNYSGFIIIIIFLFLLFFRV